MLKRSVPLTLLLVMGLLLTPLSALAAPRAQELPPDLLEVLQSAASLVAGGGGGGPAAVALPDEPVDEPPVVPEDEPVLSPEDVVIGPEVEFESGGINVLVPENWALDEGFEGMIDFADEATNFKGQIIDSGDEFPGMILFPLVEGNADLFVESFGDNTELVDVSRMLTDDGLPVLRMSFAGAEGDDGEMVSGAAYFVVTGASAIAVMGGSSPELWPPYEAALDAMVQSLLLDEELLTMELAGADGLVTEDAQGRFSLTIPAGWLVAPVEDELMGLTLADGDLTVVGAMMASETGASDAELQMLTEAVAGAADPEELASILEEIVGALELGSEDAITIDNEQTATFAGGGTSGAVGTIRVVGETVIEEGPLLPLTLYMTIFPSKVTALVFFGDPATVVGLEGDIVPMLDSVVIEE